MRSFLIVRSNEPRFRMSAYMFFVILGIVMCVSQYSLTVGFRKGEAYANSVFGSEFFHSTTDTLKQGVPDDFDAASGKYALILLMFGLAFVLKCTVKAEIRRLVSVGAFCVCLVPLWDLLMMKRLAFRYPDSARFEIFRDTLSFDIAIAAVLITLILIDLVTLVKRWNGPPEDQRRDSS